MEINTRDFVIYYNHEYGEAEKELLNTLSSNMERILHFLKLDNLKEKVDILIYSTIEDYIKHVFKCGQAYYEWMIADTFDGKINIVAIDVCKKTDSHKNISLEEYSKLIIHEFVHICQQEVNPDSYGCEWFWEALATNLSGQKMEYPNMICTKDDLMFHYAEIPNAYSISYCIGQYILQNLSYEKIYEYISKPEILRQDTEILLMSVKLHA